MSSFDIIMINIPQRASTKAGPDVVMQVSKTSNGARSTLDALDHSFFLTKVFNDVDSLVFISDKKSNSEFDAKMNSSTRDFYARYDDEPSREVNPASLTTPP